MRILVVAPSKLGFQYFIGLFILDRLSDSRIHLSTVSPEVKVDLISFINVDNHEKKINK